MVVVPRMLVISGVDIAMSQSVLSRIPPPRRSAATSARDILIFAATVVDQPSTAAAIHKKRIARWIDARFVSWDVVPMAAGS